MAVAGPTRAPATPGRTAGTTNPATPARTAGTTNPATPARTAGTTNPATPARTAGTTNPATPARTAGTTNPATPGRAGALAALTVLAALAAAACSQASEAVPEGGDRGGSGSGDDPDANGAPSRPVVEVLPGDAERPFLDPEAAPATPLGRLRAQYLPVWTSDFDGAFPPEVCSTAWELDGIAEPDSGADVAVLGDFATAAALTVMRYEHQLSRALAEPTPLSQLCVATASVGQARSEALSVLESYLANGSRRSEPAAYPDEVQILAVSPAAALSVACVTPGYPAATGAGADTVGPVLSPARLGAYLLAVSRGREDPVTDISYRVSDTADRPASDCGELVGWAAEWNGHVQTWIAEGQIWEPVDATLTADGICESPPPEGPEECPKDWPQ